MIPPLLALLAVGVQLLACLPALRTYFSNDDWIILDFYGRRPAWQVWSYFSPATVWFYRPLQAMQLSWIYHAFGLNEVPYNLSLAAMHMGVCVLGYFFVRELGERAAVAAGTTALFCATWVYADVLMWKANTNTLQWALLTLAACLAFARALNSSRRAPLLWAYAFTAADFFTKESAVTTPILLTLVWLHRRYEPGAFWRTRLAETFRSATALLAMPFLLTAAYVLFHRFCVHDVWLEDPPGYYFASPLKAVQQILFTYNHLLMAPWYSDPLLLPQLGSVGIGVGLITKWVLITPVVFLIVGAVRRDRTLIIATLWVFFTNFPTVLLTAFHASRYYYLPAFGMALALARIIDLTFAWARTQHAPGRWVRLVAPALLVWGLVGGLARLHLIAYMDQPVSDRIRDLFRFLRTEGSDLQNGSLIVLRNAPFTFIRNGLGAREMGKFSMPQQNAEVTVDGMHLRDATLQRLRAIPPERTWILDLDKLPLRLVRLVDEPTSASTTPREKV